MSATATPIQNRVVRTWSVRRGHEVRPEFTFADYIFAMRQQLASTVDRPSGGVSGRPAKHGINRIRKHLPTDDAPGDRSAEADPAQSLVKRLGDFCRLDKVESDIGTRLKDANVLSGWLTAGLLSKEEILRAYMEGLAGLEAHRDQFSAFIRLVLNEQLAVTVIPDSEFVERFRAEARARGRRIRDWTSQAVVQPARQALCDQARQTSHQQIAQRLGISPALAFNPSIVTAHVCALDPEQLFSTLKVDLLERQQKLASWVTRTVELGALNGVFGIAAWVDAQTCWFTHYAREATLTEFTLNLEDAKAAVTSSHWDYFLDANEVHLINAELLDGVPGWMVLPKPIERIVSGVPSLLQPYVGTIDGTVVRERKIRSTVGKFETKDVIELPLPAPKPDPALVIGNIVLAGWSSAAVDPAWRFLDYFQSSLRDVKTLGI